MVDYLGKYEDFIILMGKSLMAQMVDVGVYGTVNVRDEAKAIGQKFGQLQLVAAQSDSQVRSTAHISVMNEMNIAKLMDTQTDEDIVECVLEMKVLTVELMDNPRERMIKYPSAPDCRTYVFEQKRITVGRWRQSAAKRQRTEH